MTEVSTDDQVRQQLQAAAEQLRPFATADTMGSESLAAAVRGLARRVTGEPVEPGANDQPSDGKDWS